MTMKKPHASPSEPRPIRVHIRWLIRSDMLDVLDIEAASFEFPWSREDFIRCLRHRNCIGMVAEHEEQILGYMIYELHRDRLHLLSLAVHQEFRLRNVGRQLIEKLVSKLSFGPGRRNHIDLECREANLPAQKFFRSLGFRAVKVLPGFYHDTDEAAYLFRYRMAANQSDPPHQNLTVH